jgi:hypothetical protein
MSLPVLEEGKFMDEQEYGGIEYEDFEVEAPRSGLESVLMVFTMIFLLLGIALMGFELYRDYGFFGNTRSRIDSGE